MNNNREAFEEWAKDHNPDLFMFDTHPSGIYCDDITYGAWLGYQAGLASQAQQPSEEFKAAALQELYAFQEATGCDIAAELKPHQLSQSQQEPTKAANLFEIVTYGESGDAWLLLRADVNLGLGHHCIKFDGAAADDLRKRFKVMGSIRSQAQQTESQWISVDERLPEGYKPVLVATNFGDVYTCRLPVIIAKNSKEELSVGKRERFTHWMPLPPAPMNEVNKPEGESK